MPKYPIEKGVPTNVSVTKDPAVSELHRSLAGPEALAGSPAGREARPNPKIVAPMKAPSVPR